MEVAERVYSRSEVQHLSSVEHAWASQGVDIDRDDVRALIGVGIPPVVGSASRAQVQRPRDDLSNQGAVIPFTSAAHEHTEGFVDVTALATAAENTLQSPHDVPAYGYLRAVWIHVVGTGGALGAGVLNADYPFNVFSRIELTDVNGAPIHGPLDGFGTAMQNIYGGAAGLVNDPRVAPGYVGTIDTNFAIRVPLEISHRDGMGSLANQNSAAAYKLSLTLNTLANLVTGGTPTSPSFRVRCYAECWTIPNEVDILGRRQAQIPPRLGTTQYVSHFLTDISAGANTIRLTRVGNLFRVLVFIARTTAGARQDNVFPDPVDVSWDARDIHRQVPQRYLTQYMREKLPDLTTRDTGVFALPFNISDHNAIGDDAPTFWWPTVQSSRIEINGSAVTAGRLDVITTEVAPVELTPDERYELESQTGFTPEVGAPVRR